MHRNSVIETPTNGCQPLLTVAGPTAQCGTKTAAVPSLTTNGWIWAVTIEVLLPEMKMAGEDNHLFKKRSKSSKALVQAFLADLNILICGTRETAHSGCEYRIAPRHTKVSTMLAFHSSI